MTLADQLQAVREKRHLSQEGAARLLDVPLTTYGRWERGVSFPRPDALAKIAEVLGIVIEAKVKKP